MGKLRIFSTISICFAIALIVLGNYMMFMDEYVVDAQTNDTYQSMIKTSFNSHTIDLETISNEIKESEIFTLRYYDDIKANYEINIAELNHIEQTLKAKETTSEDLIFECQRKDYNDYEIDYTCSTISYNYESVINAYISLIEQYNIKINNYNKWLISENITDEQSLNIYQSSNYYEFVDINGDGEYSGIIK